MIYCTCGHLLVESESSQMFSQWRVDALSITHYVIKKKNTPTMLGTAKPTHRKSILWPTIGGRDVSKRILMEFTIVSNEIRYIVFRNSKLAGPRRSASQWINWHRKTTPTAHPLRNMKISEKLVYLIEQIGQECTDETPIRLPTSSHIHEPSPPRIWRRTTRTNFPLSIPKVAFVFFFQFLMVAVESKLVELIVFQKNVVAGSFTADGNLLQTTRCVNSTPSHVTFFSCLCARMCKCCVARHRLKAQVFVRVISSMCHAHVCLTSLRPSFRTLHLSLPSSTSSS